jgi:hypothetical protein
MVPRIPQTSSSNKKLDRLQKKGASQKVNPRMLVALVQEPGVKEKKAFSTYTNCGISSIRQDRGVRFTEKQRIGKRSRITEKSQICNQLVTRSEIYNEA